MTSCSSANRGSCRGENRAAVLTVDEVATVRERMDSLSAVG